jgi:proliferating cell nuclear antigen PCNA
MATFCTKQISAMRAVTYTIRKLIEDVIMHFTKQGIYISTMDASHCALVQLDFRGDIINSSATGTYECTTECTAALNFKLLNKIMRTVGTNDEVEFVMDTADEDIIKVSVRESDEQNESTMCISLLDLNETELNVPDMKYDAEIHMSPEKFKQILSNLSITDNDVTISCSDGEVMFSSKGDDIKTACKRVKVSNDVKMTYEEPVSMTFSRRFLAIFAKPTSLSASVSICMAKEQPIMVAYNITGLGVLRMFLAPDE